MQMQEEQTDAKLHKPAKCSISVSCYTVLVTNVHIRPTDNAPPYNKESSHSTGCHIPTRPPLHNAQWDCHHSATYFLLYFPSTNGYGYFFRFRFHLKKERFPLINIQLPCKATVSFRTVIRPYPSIRQNLKRPGENNDHIKQIPLPVPPIVRR